MGTSTKKSAKAKKAAPAPEPEVEDTDLEDLEEDEVEEATEAKGKGSKAKKTTAAQAVTFGASDLAKWITENVEGAKVDARGIRTLIRKMARDGSGRVTREIVPGNRTRYDWSGPEDPEVLKIIEAFKGGELEADKKEKLDALKANKKAKDEAAAKGEKPAKGKKKKAAPAPVVEEEDDDDDDGDLELDDDE